MYKIKNLIKFLIIILLLGNTNVSGKATLCFPNGNPCLTVDSDLDGNDACCDNMDLAPGVSCSDDCPLLAINDPLNGNHPTSQPSHFTVGDNDEIDVWIYKDGEISTATYDNSTIEYIMLNMGEENGVFTFLSVEETAIVGFAEPTDDPEYDPDNPLYHDLYDGGTYAYIRLTSNTSRKKYNTELTSKNNNLNVYPNPVLKDRNLTIANEEGFSLIRVLNVQGQLIENISFNTISEGKVEVTLPQSLNSGIYFIEVLGNNNERKIEKLFLN